MTRRIPLIVIGGFLGAGKTTLLNHLLTHAGDRKIAVLVNDFGPINVDAALVAAHDGETLSLTNGCVCCSMSSGLEDALTRVLNRSHPVDLIVIEASGVSDPSRIAQVGLSDPLLQLQAIVVIADVAQLISQLDDPLLGDTLERQIKAASLLVLNKIDLASAVQIATTRTRVQTQFGTLAVIQTQDAIIPISALAEDLNRQPFPASTAAPGRHKSNLHVHHNHEHDVSEIPDHPFESGTWRGTGVLNADRLIEALKHLPRTIMRAKGWVMTDRHGAAIVQFAGGRVRIERATQAISLQENEIVYLSIRGTHGQDEIESALNPLTSNARPRQAE